MFVFIEIYLLRHETGHIITYIYLPGFTNLINIITIFEALLISFFVKIDIHVVTVFSTFIFFSKSMAILLVRIIPPMMPFPRDWPSIARVASQVTMLIQRRVVR